jgi:hypothetical protein
MPIPFSEAETRAKLIEAALHACGWTARGAHIKGEINKDGITPASRYFFESRSFPFK